MRTLDPEPLLRAAAAGVNWQDNVLDHHTAQGPSVLALAARLGISPQTVHRWRNGQYRVSFWFADRLCVHQLGLHPSEVWGRAFFEVVVDGEEN